MPKTSLIFIIFSLICNSLVSHGSASSIHDLVAQFRQQFSLYPIETSYRNYKISNYERDIDTEAFNIFAKDLFSLMEQKPAVIDDITLRDLANMMKQVLSIAMFDDQINFQVQHVFKKYSMYFFLFLQKRDRFQGRSLMRYYQNIDALDREGFFQFLRRENDILYLAAVTSGLISADHKVDQEQVEVVNLLGELAEVSYFRIYFLLRRFRSMNLDSGSIIQKSLSEDLRKQNQAIGIDFDTPFGRYAQAGEAIEKFLKFERKLQTHPSPEWVKTRRLHGQIVEQIERSLQARISFETLVYALRQPLSGFNQKSALTMVAGGRTFEAWK